MKTVTGKTFKFKDVPLDGFEYDQCVFESCTLVYAATDEFALTNDTIFPDCRFHFVGAAGDALATLKVIYASFGEWGRDSIRRTFQEIAPDIKNLH